MIVEMRTYTVQPGKTGAWVEFYEKRGFPTQQRMLGKLIGFFTSEIGTLNQVVHLWAYESLADRERRRAEMAKDPEWQAYLRDQPLVLLAQESQILNPTSFSPLK